MNVASTVEIASVVDPNTSPSWRVHRLSRISPDEPDRKKQASRIARMKGRTLYDRRRRAGYLEGRSLCPVPDGDDPDCRLLHSIEESIGWDDHFSVLQLGKLGEPPP